MSIDIERQHRSPELDPVPHKSSTLFPALRSWSSRPPGHSRLRCIAHTAGARAAAASAGADGGWNSDTGREFRHGQRHAQPRIPNCKRRCDACEEFPEASAIVPRHGLVRNFESVISVPPTHPTYPFHSSSCVVAWHRNGAAQWDRPPPRHHPSQCWAGPTAWREGSGVVSHALMRVRKKQAPGERTSK